MVAQSDVGPPGISKVVGLILQSGKTFFLGDWSRNISTAILCLPLIQVRQLSVTGERMCTGTG